MEVTIPMLHGTGIFFLLDGPADVLMKLFFKSNPKLGMRDRGLIAEGIYYALRHYASIRWAMRPVRPDRAPRLAAPLPNPRSVPKRAP